MSITDHAKRALWWTFVYPVFPFFHEVLLFGKKLLRKNRRGPFFMGVLSPQRSVNEFLQYLVAQGFDRNRFSWRNPGQAVSVRRLDGFHWQYHLRVFRDGEVRVHYEKTPEAHPFDHFFGRGLEHRTDYFQKLLGGWVTAPVAVRANENTGFRS